MKNNPAHAKVYQREYYKKNKDKILKRNAKAYELPEVRERHRASHLRRKHNMSVEEYARKNASQSGLCMICNQPTSDGRNLAVDHDHTTGENRDLLCDLCNRGLGLFRDSVNILRNATAYLERWKK